MKKILFLFLIGLLSISMLAGCSYYTRNTGDMPDTKDTITPVQTAATSIGNFNAQDVNGNPVTKDIFSNYDLTLVNLFATWCSPCIKEIPDLNAIDQEMAGKSFNVIGIPIDVNESGKIDSAKMDKLKQIIKSTNAQYDIIIPDSVLRNGPLKGINTVPQSFFVDKNGNIVGQTYQGSHSKAEWESIINKELAAVQK